MYMHGNGKIVESLYVGIFWNEDISFNHNMHGSSREVYNTTEVMTPSFNQDTSSCLKVYAIKRYHCSQRVCYHRSCYIACFINLDKKVYSGELSVTWIPSLNNRHTNSFWHNQQWIRNTVVACLPQKVTKSYYTNFITPTVYSIDFSSWSSHHAHSEHYKQDFYKRK